MQDCPCCVGIVSDFLVQRITWFKVYIAATSFDKSVYLFIVNVLPDLINLSIYLS